jgi:hypothetical protein
MKSFSIPSLSIAYSDEIYGEPTSKNGRVGSVEDNYWLTMMLKVLEILDTRVLYDRGMSFEQRRLHLI